MYSDYKELSEFLKQNVISNDNLYKTNIYKCALKLVDNNDNVIISKIESMANKKTPNRVRIRSDKFIRYASENKKAILLTGIELNNNKIYLAFFSSSFYDYKHSLKSSNSFINFPFEELNEYIYNGQDTINIKNNNTKKNKEKIKYVFYSTLDKNFDENKFIDFYNNSLKFNDNSITKYSGNEFFVPPIPIEIKKIVKNDFNKRCALCSLDREHINYCPCGYDINVDYLDKNDLSYTHLHHLVPKKYFLNDCETSYINWNIVHNKLNIVPLCPACHQSIHKGLKSTELVSSVYNAILDIYKKIGKYEEFTHFLKNNTKFSDTDDLLNFYKGISNLK